MPPPFFLSSKHHSTLCIFFKDLQYAEIVKFKKKNYLVIFIYYTYIFFWKKYQSVLLGAEGVSTPCIIGLYYVVVLVIENKQASFGSHPLKYKIKWLDLLQCFYWEKGIVQVYKSIFFILIVAPFNWWFDEVGYTLNLALSLIIVEIENKSKKND